MMNSARKNLITLGRNGVRPNFEKYREDLLDYLDDTMVKSEIIRREQNQSSKPDLNQRNYTFISEFTTNLDSKPDRRKVISAFYRKIQQLEDERDMLNIKDAISNIELTIHIYQCILHIREKMKIDLVLYRGFKAKKKYKLKNYIDFKKLKKRRKREKEQFNRCLQLLNSSYEIKRINELRKKLNNLKVQEEER